MLAGGCAAVETSAEGRGSRGERELQCLYESTKRAKAFYDNQMLDYLNDRMREFIARQEFAFIATADEHGNCDASFRAGEPGFVRVANERLLLMPDYRGNGVRASMGNIVENGHIGIMFVDFYRDTIGLHVNGRAWIAENEILAHDPVTAALVHVDIETNGGRKPERWICVEVEEAYVHCSKHIPLLQKLDKNIVWGTDDAVAKGGDYFHVRRNRRAIIETIDG